MRLPIWIVGILLARLVLMWATGQTQQEAMVWPPDWQTWLSIPLGLLGAYGFVRLMDLGVDSDQEHTPPPRRSS